MTAAYRQMLFVMSWTVNSIAWRGFAIGEVLFEGASGSKRNQDDWELTFKFAASPNAGGLAIGDITGIVKRGWDYLWVRYADQVDSSAEALVKRPLAVYVEQVYKYTDFTNLGLGT